MSKHTKGDKERTDKLYRKRQGDYRVTETLFAIINLKDPPTAQHCESVAKYAVAIGKEIGLPGDMLDKLHQAALLHDIGKVMVDNCVLNNRESLTDREFLQIRGHAEKGMRILTLFPVPAVIVDAAWHHHESWDGSGYPDGISGNSILQLTRIVSIADSLDAMSEDRPYRRHLTDSEILVQLSEGRGKQFDPELADVAIRLIQEQRIR